MADADVTVHDVRTFGQPGEEGRLRIRTAAPSGNALEVCGPYV